MFGLMFVFKWWTYTDAVIYMDLHGLLKIKDIVIENTSFLIGTQFPRRGEMILSLITPTLYHEKLENVHLIFIISL